MDVGCAQDQVKKERKREKKKMMQEEDVAQRCAIG